MGSASASVLYNPSQVKYPVGLHSNTTTSYFVDQNGAPIFLLYDNPWTLIPNAGRWNGSGGGTWEQDIDNYVTSRAAQGYSGVYLTPFGDLENIGPYANGNTWDGVTPFNSGEDPTTGLNNTYWVRVDRLINNCQTSGLVVILNIGYTGGNGADIDTGGVLDPARLTSTQFQAWGTAVATRYLSTPNIIWAVGNDQSGGWPDSYFSSIYTGVRSVDTTKVWTDHTYAEADSRYEFSSSGAGSTADPFALTHVDYTMVYTYIQTYYGVEYAYGESSPITVIWGDGYFQNGEGAAEDTDMRQFVWWAAASGARGSTATSEDQFTWTAAAPALTAQYVSMPGWPATLTGSQWFRSQAKWVRAIIEPLPGWWNLLPDTSNVLITGGRGTRCSATTPNGGGRTYQGTTDNYIAASRVSNGSLALIYFSAGTSGQTITIDQTKMVSGYTATWIDPTNGAKTSATPSSTYTNPGLNSVGYSDWVLVLQGP